MVDRKDVIIVGATITIIALVVTVLILVASVRISGHGSVKSVGIGIFADAACTQPVTDIDWGTINAGGYSMTYFYVKNTGNTPLNVTYSTENWNPVVAKNYLTLTWNMTNPILAASEVRVVSMNLNVAQNITGVTNFSFDIVIRGEG